MFKISENKLKELLLEAYTSGWYGVRELKEDTIEELIRNAKLEPIPEPVSEPEVVGRRATTPAINSDWMGGMGRVMGDGGGGGGSGSVESSRFHSGGSSGSISETGVFQIGSGGGRNIRVTVGSNIAQQHHNDAMEAAAFLAGTAPAPVQNDSHEPVTEHWRISPEAANIQIELPVEIPDPTPTQQAEMNNIIDRVVRSLGIPTTNLDNAWDNIANNF